MTNPTTATTVIPPALSAMLQGLRPLLCRRGTVLRRGEADRRDAWRLRYRELGSDVKRCRHRSIPLGDAHVATQVTELLRHWRSAERERVRAADAARKSERES